jgi:hypothetical protein
VIPKKSPEKENLRVEGLYVNATLPLGRPGEEMLIV